MKKHHTIKYQVHPTPMKEGDTVQTYHVRRSSLQVIHTEELAEHIQSHTMIDHGLLEMVLERLKREIAEHLLDNKDVHLDGIGRFGLVYNNMRWYAGASVIVRMNNYHKSRFSTNNIFGSMNMYVGYNFGLKKRYRRATR